MGRWDSYPVVDGSKTNGLDDERRNTRIKFYIIVGLILLVSGIIIYLILPKNQFDNPYTKTDTGFQMPKNSMLLTPPVDIKDSETDGSSEYNNIFEEPPTTEDFPDGAKLTGYATVEECITTDELTVAKISLYSDGKTDNFLNHLDRVFDAVCIDPSLEPPHDGHNREHYNQWSGDKVGQGVGEDWWYELTDYGYTATLNKKELKGNQSYYDWNVVVNFNYGEYTENAQRVKFHITYEA